MDLAAVDPQVVWSGITGLKGVVREAQRARARAEAQAVEADERYYKEGKGAAQAKEVEEEMPGVLGPLGRSVPTPHRRRFLHLEGNYDARPDAAAFLKAKHHGHRSLATVRQAVLLHWKQLAQRIHDRLVPIVEQNRKVPTSRSRAERTKNLCLRANRCLCGEAEAVWDMWSKLEVAVKAEFGKGLKAPLVDAEVIIVFLGVY